MPKMTYQDMITKLLPEDEIQEFLACYKERLPKTIKIITQKISIQDFEHITKEWGREIEKTVQPDIFYVHKRTGSPTLGQHFLHQAGFFYIQELSASMSAPLLDAKNGELVLDLCAAPGGKTIQLADTGAFVVANEPLNPRRKALIYNLNRTGMINTAVTNFDGTRYGDLYPEMFDKVLVDAPCSGEGMSYKTGGPLSWNEGLVESLARTQLRLLESAFHTCKSGGTIVYSTCTLNDIENEKVIEKFLEAFGSSISLEYSKKFWPHKEKGGGFFVAKIIKNNEIKQEKSNKIPRIPDFITSQELQKKVREKLSNDFRITDVPSDYLFLSTTNTLYLTTQSYLKIHTTLSVDKVGIPLYDISSRGQWIPTHHLGNIFGYIASQNVFSLTDDQAQAYSLGKDISLDEQLLSTADNFILLTWRKLSFSLGKIVGDFIKNKML